MKTQKSLLFFIILFSFANFLAQPQGIQQIVTRYTVAEASVKYYNENGCYSSSSYSRFDPYVGYLYTSNYNSQLHCYRNISQKWNRAFKFDFSLPSNAILTKVELLVSNNYNAEIVTAPEDIFNYSDVDFYTSIQVGSKLFDVPTTEYQDITNYASQYLSYGHFCVGARSMSNTQYISIICRLTYEIPIHITFQNNMGGQISVNGSNNTGSYSNDYWLGTNITVSVNEPQYTSEYTWIWNDSEAPSNKSEWKKIKNGEFWKSYNQSYNFSVVADDNNSTYKAYLKKICNLTFLNYFVGLSSYGTITVNGQSYSSPTSQFQVVEQNAIDVSVNTYYYNNGIEYNFSQWNDGNTSNPRTFFPSSHYNYSANYIGKPTNSGEYVNFGSSVGQPIVIYWIDNSNTNVTQYQIWRRVKHNGVVGPDTHIGTVNRGVQSFTDYSYLLTASYSADLIWYDVRAYYSVEGTYSDPQWSAVFGEYDLAPKIKDDNSNNIITVASELPTKYSISNYPNPFNPSTTIKYQLPESGHVTIKVYDILGKEITTLVSEIKQAGYHKINFVACKLTSGIYIYSIKTNNFTQSKKMILTINNIVPKLFVKERSLTSM